MFKKCFGSKKDKNSPKNRSNTTAQLGMGLVEDNRRYPRIASINLGGDLPHSNLVK